MGRRFWRMAVILCVAAAWPARGAFAQIPAKPEKIALYAGPDGMMSKELGAFLTAQKILFDTVDDKDVLAGKLSRYPAAIFPGGGGPKLSEEAVKTLKDYISAGGGYIGICASATFARQIGLVKFKSLHVRGIGWYYLAIFDHPITKGYMLTGTAPKGDPGADYVRIARVNGDFMAPIPGEGVKVIASYDMEGTLGAIIGAQLGKGEVILISPHCEMAVERPPGWEWQKWQEPAKLLVNAIEFVSKGRVKPTE